MLSQDRGSAIAVVLVDRDHEIWSEGFGLTNRETGAAATGSTLFSIASASKTLAAVAVMQLVDRGLVDLDAPFVQYVPEFRMLSPEYLDITVRMLLDHSSGIPGTDYRNVQGRVPRTDYLDQVMASLSQEWLKAQPGFTNVYCNDGFTLIEALVAAVTGTSYVDYVHDRIFAPLGMTQTRFALQPFADGTYAKAYAKGQPQRQDFLNAQASGGVWSTAEDLGRFARMFLGHKPEGSIQILSPEAIATMGKDGTAGRFHPVRSNAMAFGLGWDSVSQPGLAAVGQKGWIKGGDTELWHYGVAILVAPEAGLAVVAMGTAGLGSTGATAIAERVMLRALVDSGRISAFPTPLQKMLPGPAPVPEGLLTSMAGVYANEGALFQLQPGPQDSLLILRAFPDPENPGGSPAVWVPLSALPYRPDGTFSPDANPLESYRVVAAQGGQYLVRRAPAGYGHYLDESEFGDRIIPAGKPLSDAWAKRIGQSWLVVNDSPDSVYWPRGDPRLRVAEVIELPGRIAVLPSGGDFTILDPSTDDLVARILQPTGRDLNNLVVIPREGEEWMRHGSFLNRPIASVQQLPTAASTTIAIGPEGNAEWRAVQTGPSARTVQVGTARAWALYDQGFTLLASGQASGLASLPATNEGRGYLQVYGDPDSFVEVAVQ
jgi:CubicO group peptidase (beta-lactamase class C family)